MYDNFGIIQIYRKKNIINIFRCAWMHIYIMYFQKLCLFEESSIKTFNF